MTFLRKFENKKILFPAGIIFLAGIFFGLAVNVPFSKDSSNRLSQGSLFKEAESSSLFCSKAEAAAPDPDHCGSDAVSCNGNNPEANVSWQKAPSSFRTSSGKRCYFRYYKFYLGNDLIAKPTSPSYKINSGLKSDSTYQWRIGAQYSCGDFIDLGGSDTPRGAFKTPRCLKVWWKEIAPW